MTAPAHSPLPWQVEKDCSCSILDANGNSLAILSVADVRLIVTAVNSHAELLSAAKRIIAAAHWSPNRGTFCEDAGAFKALSDAIANAEKDMP
jgi:hypothetical protein